MQSKNMDNCGNTINEASLIQNFRNGNLSNAELTYLLRDITRYIRRSYKRLFPDADDIASEAVFEAYKSKENLQNETLFFGWVRGIASHIALKQLKEAKLLPTHSRDNILGQANDESPEEVQALQEQIGFDDEAWLRKMSLMEARASLSEEQQAVITLRIDEQQPSKVVAEMLGKSDANVRQIEVRACRKMRDYLVSNGYADLFHSRQLPKKRPASSAPVKNSAPLPAGI